jgi:hypothetical protein
MSTETTKKYKKETNSPLLINNEERLKIWKRARGLWKKRKPDPIKELKRIREDW